MPEKDQSNLRVDLLIPYYSVQPVRISREEALEGNIVAEDDDPRGVHIPPFLGRIAAVPEIMGVAFSQMKHFGSIYLTMIVSGDMAPTDEWRKPVGDARLELGQNIGQPDIPGSTLYLWEGQDINIRMQEFREDILMDEELELASIVLFE